MSKASWEIVLIAGMGFFLDAYDPFIIGVVLSVFVLEWHMRHSLA